jgi:DNA-binding transcriptional MerR regulator
MYSIREVCEMLDVKPYTLRYWERIIPLVTPRKDRYGRRVYTRGEVNILARIKHLVRDKGLTLQGAGQRLWEEIRSGPTSGRSRIAEIREDLLKVREIIRKRSEEIGLDGEQQND